MVVRHCHLTSAVAILTLVVIGMGYSAAFPSRNDAASSYAHSESHVSRKILDVSSSTHENVGTSPQQKRLTWRRLLHDLEEDEMALAIANDAIGVGGVTPIESKLSDGIPDKVSRAVSDGGRVTSSARQQEEDEVPFRRTANGRKKGKSRRKTKKGKKTKRKRGMERSQSHEEDRNERESLEPRIDQSAGKKNGPSEINEIETSEGGMESGRGGGGGGGHMEAEEGGGDASGVQGRQTRNEDMQRGAEMMGEGGEFGDSREGSESESITPEGERGNGEEGGDRVAREALSSEDRSDNEGGVGESGDIEREEVEGHDVGMEDEIGGAGGGKESEEEGEGGKGTKSASAASQDEEEEEEREGSSSSSSSRERESEESSPAKVSDTVGVDGDRAASRRSMRRDSEVKDGQGEGEGEGEGEGREAYREGSESQAGVDHAASDMEEREDGEGDGENVEKVKKQGVLRLQNEERDEAADDPSSRDIPRASVVTDKAHGGAEDGEESESGGEFPRPSAAAAEKAVNGAVAVDGAAAVQEVAAREQEDSGNSGVADEIALRGVRDGSVVEKGGDEPVAVFTSAKDEGEEVVTLTKAEQLKIAAESVEDSEAHAGFMSKMMGIQKKLAPTWAGVRAKAAKHVIPTLSQLASSSRSAFVKTSSFLSTRIDPYLGSAYTPLLASLLSYFLLLLPLSLILLLLYHARVVLTVRKLQLLANLYLCLYCAVLFASCVVIGAEPMASLQQASEPSYLSLQLLQAAAFVLYLVLQCVVLTLDIQGRLHMRHRGQLHSSPRPILLSSTMQVVIAVAVGLHYYVTVFEPAMLDKPPQIHTFAYLVYCVAFVALTSLSRRSSKEASEKQK